MKDIKREQLSEQDIDQLWNRIEQDIDKYENRKRHVRLTRLTRYAIAAIAIVGIFAITHYYFFNNNSDSKKEQLAKNNVAMERNYFTGNAEVNQIYLSDGTKIWMNANTKLYAPKEFYGDTREIKVEGEIYVEAAHDQKHPFIVHTENALVEVLGTKFSVKSKPSEHYDNVVLVSGSVAVNSKESGNKTILSPNQKLEIRNNEYSVKNVDSHALVSWTQGIYIYNNKPLGIILEQLAEYYGKKINITSSKNSCFTGKIDLSNSFDEILKGLSHMQYIDYDYNSDNYAIKIF